MFKRSQRGEVGKEGVTMLVPNPSSVAKAQIGNRDFDLVSPAEDLVVRSISLNCFQVSELSERQSVGSFEISSSSEDDFEEEGLEEEERDQEYTIYSVLPNRQLEVVTKLEEKSQPSSKRSGGLEGLNVRSKTKGDEGRSGGGVRITSVPQSSTVHEGKILNLTCTVDGPKYTGKPAL